MQLFVSFRVLAFVLSFFLHAWHGMVLVWVGFVHACVHIFQFCIVEVQSLMCIHALNSNATYIACARVFFNAIYVSVCCCDYVVIMLWSHLISSIVSVFLVVCSSLSAP